MNEKFRSVIDMTRSNKDQWTAFEKITKLGEEVGELAEGTLVLFGKIAAKPGVGEPLEEGVDVILMVLDVLSTCYPDLTSEQLVEEMSKMLTSKQTKWKGLIETSTGLA